jgi:mono/diheme cytochrome c family protein
MHWLAILVLVLAHAGEAAGQTAPDGRRTYEAACAACHGADGRGEAAADSGYPLALPDFSDCTFASREPDGDWLAISHAGGPARGFSRLMPAFGEALAREDLQRVLAYIRGFCTSGAWPPRRVEPAAGAGDDQGVPRRRSRAHRHRRTRRRDEHVRLRTPPGTTQPG